MNCKAQLQNLAVLCAATLLSGSAQAAFFSLTPQGSTSIGVGSTVSFDARWTQEAGDPNAGANDLHIVVQDSAVAGITSANTNGNPFQLPALGLTFGAGLPDEMIMGGADIFGVGKSGTILLGAITLTGNSPGSTNILSGQFTQWVDTGAIVGLDTTPAILATVFVPEPTVLLLLGLGAAGLALRKRVTSGPQSFGHRCLGSTCGRRPSGASQPDAAGAGFLNAH